jgi:hypothetical protein
MCELRHPSISTSRIPLLLITGKELQVPFIGVDKLLDKSAVVSIDEAALIPLRIKV